MSGALSIVPVRCLLEQEHLLLGTGAGLGYTLTRRLVSSLERTPESLWSTQRRTRYVLSSSQLHTSTPHNQLCCSALYARHLPSFLLTSCLLLQYKNTADLSVRYPRKSMTCKSSYYPPTHPTTDQPYIIT